MPEATLRSSICLNPELKKAREINWGDFLRTVTIEFNLDDVIGGY